jgi:hypothetical protein
MTIKRYFAVILILVSFCSSCNKDEVLDENGKTEIWKPLLTSIRHDSYIEIQWLNPMIFEIFLRPYTFIDPDAFEIYLSKNDPQHLEKIATLGNDKKYKYEIRNLTNGHYYFLAVKALKKGKLPLMSDPIMVIPSVPEKIQQITANKDFPMESGSISKNHQVLAYVNRYFTWDNGKYGQMSLFAFDLISHKNTIIDTAAYFPDWSPSEMKVVYCSDKHEINKENRLSQQLAIYDYQTNKIKRLTQGESFNTNPDFSYDGNWIIYSSDEGHHDVFDLWKISVNGSQKVQITENLNLTSSSIGNVALGRPSCSNDGNYVYFNVLENGKTKNGIYRVSLQNKVIEPVITSQWTDVCPAISPDNKQVAFISNRSGTNQIWIYNLITNKYNQITGDTGDNINTDWGKIEWMNENSILYGGYSSENTNESIFTIDLN